MLCSDSDNDEETKPFVEKCEDDDSKNKEEAIKQYVLIHFICILKVIFFLQLISFFRPCILIFDSLAGTSRSRVVATLRDYLTCEYHVKVII